MHCIRKITPDLTWVGANDRRLAMFEGVYSVPKGVSYNSYLLADQKTVLFDTVDKAVTRRFIENLLEALGGRPLDYLVVQHMEPDHSAALEELIARFPGLTVVCNARTLAFIGQFYGPEPRAHIVGENDTLCTGAHTLRFLMAPMVHWPEVMVTYDETDKTLFSADAFGCFGALNGALFAHEVDFDRDYMDEARRYYSNIVGKYGAQTAALLKKAAALEINRICPLHGFVWSESAGDILAKYTLWSEYKPEKNGVLIAYASVYGNTENAAEILACRLRELDVPAVMFDVSVTHASEIISAAFEWSHLVFASTTYNMGIFVTMEALLSDLVAHNLQNRTVALIENGSWAASSGALMREKLSKCKGFNILEQKISIKSALKAEQEDEIDALARALAQTIPRAAPRAERGEVERQAMFRLSYGLFLLTARDGGRDNGCIINTVCQLTGAPVTVSIAVSKANMTHDMILATGEFNLSVLTESAPYGVFERFGMKSGRDADKLAGFELRRAENGICYAHVHANAVLCAVVTQTIDCSTHTLFIADITRAFSLGNEPSATYRHYHERVKPHAAQSGEGGYVCKACGYVHESETLPDDFVCPLCKHGAADFERRR